MFQAQANGRARVLDHVGAFWFQFGLIIIDFSGFCGLIRGIARYVGDKFWKAKEDTYSENDTCRELSGRCARDFGHKMS